MKLRAVQVMTEIVAQKFDPILHPDLVDMLLNTGEAQLCEVASPRSRKRDESKGRKPFWSCYKSDRVGDNHLGQILMNRRALLRLRLAV